MPHSLITLAYLAAGLLFIFSLNGLSAQESARRGNLLGILGMVMAVVATAIGARGANYGVLMAALVVGGGIGAVLATRVAMTNMPQLVAILLATINVAGGFLVTQRMLRMFRR